VTEAVLIFRDPSDREHVFAPILPHCRFEDLDMAEERKEMKMRLERKEAGLTFEVSGE
jgi:hypothetical protein